LIQGRFVAAFGKGNQLPGFVAAIVAQGSLTSVSQTYCVNVTNFRKNSQRNRPVARFFPFVKVEQAGLKRTGTVPVQNQNPIV